MTYFAMDFTELFEHFRERRRNHEKPPFERPPENLIQNILDCANYSKVAGALQRLIFVLMQGEPEVVGNGNESLVDHLGLQQFLRDAAWSILVFNMVAFYVNIEKSGKVRPVCVPISERNIRRFRNPRTGDLVYSWAKRRSEPVRATVFSVNPADLGGQWFASPVLHLQEAIQTHQMMLSNFLNVDFALSQPHLVLAYNRSNLFAARAMGDSTVGDISENNAQGVVSMMNAVSQAVHNDLEINPNATLTSSQYDINASKHARATTSAYVEAGPGFDISGGAFGTNQSRTFRAGNSNLLYVTPGYAPAGGVMPSRNPEFLRNMVVEREISAQLGLPLAWLAESSGRRTNTTESEGDADKLKISIEILRRHLTELIRVVEGSVKKRLPPNEDDESPEGALFELVWRRDIQFHFVYSDKQGAGNADCDSTPDAKRVKTEPSEEEKTTEVEGEFDESGDDSAGPSADGV